MYQKSHSWVELIRNWLFRNWNWIGIDFSQNQRNWNWLRNWKKGIGMEFGIDKKELTPTLPTTFIILPPTIIMHHYAAPTTITSHNHHHHAPPTAFATSPPTITTTMHHRSQSPPTITTTMKALTTFTTSLPTITTTMHVAPTTVLRHITSHNHHHYATTITISEHTITTTMHYHSQPFTTQCIRPHYQTSHHSTHILWHINRGLPSDGDAISNIHLIGLNCLIMFITPFLPGGSIF